VDYAQVLSHMRLLGAPVALLINFHVTVLRDGISRLVNDYQEEPNSEIPANEEPELQ
jgi:hypothetical protein